MKKSAYIYLLLCLLLVPHLAHAKSEEIIVGTSGTTKPFNYVDEGTGELTGFEIDLLRGIDERLPAYHFTFETTEFDALFGGLSSGRFDLICNNLGEKGDRREAYLFSLYPYVITHNVLITQEAGPFSIEDMGGKRMGVVVGGPQSAFLESWNQEHPDQAVELIYVQADPATIILDTYNGRYDGTIYATTYVKDVEKTYGIRLNTSPIADEAAIRPPGSYFLYPKEGREDLRNEMDRILSEMRRDGTLAALSEEYFGSDDTILDAAMTEKNDRIERERLEAAKGSTFFDPAAIGLALPKIAGKLPVTLLMTVVAAGIGLLMGLLLTWMQTRRNALLNALASLYISFMRGTPQLVQLFLAYYGLPVLLLSLNSSRGTAFNVQELSPLLFVFLAFGLNEGAYLSEIFRSALLAVPVEEVEGAKSIGLTDGQITRRIIIPNALMIALPNLGNALISLMKATSLAFTVTIVDIMGEGRILAAGNLRYFESYIAVALIYWGSCIVIELLFRGLEGHFAIPDKKGER